MNRKRAKRIGSRIGGALASRFGPRRHYSRSEIERVCEERGYSVADDLLMAMVLFGPQDLAAELTITLALDFDPGQLIEESSDVLALAPDTEGLLGDGLE